MSKKQKRISPKQLPTKHQLSRLQRQTRMRRIIVISAAIFLAGIIGYVGYGYYKSEVKPLREIVIEVNDTSFNMDYYIEALDVYTEGMTSDQVYQMSTFLADQIKHDELIRQRVTSLGIELTNEEIEDINRQIKEKKLPHDKVYQGILTSRLLTNKLVEEYLEPQIPNPVEQAHIQVMLVESEQVADKVTAEMESSGNFTALLDKFSCHPQTEGDLGWLPRELMPNSFIEEAAFSLEPGGISKIYDESATKNIGYWLIEVIGKDEEKGIKVRAILLGSEQEALEIRTKVDEDEDFATLAKEYSQHESKDNGGELGWLKPEDIHGWAFNETAISLSLNEISEPIEDESSQTKGGYWIVKVLGKEERELEEEAKNELIQKAFNEWFKKQWESSTINDFLNEEKRAWAVNRILKGRTPS